MMKAKSARSLDAAIAIGGTLLALAAAFCFFQLCYQQHLLHREQNSLFLCSAQYIAETYHGIGWLSRVAGDFLTQYFYYLGAGAAILAIALALIWLSAYVFVRQCAGYSKSKILVWLAAAVATLAALWQGLRETGYAFQFSSTISIIALLLIANAVAWAWRRSTAAGIVSAVVLAPLGIWGFGHQSGRWIDSPDFAMERVMAIDNAAYFGDWDKVRRLSADMPDSRLAVFYNSLSAARQGQLTDAIKDKIALGPEVLLPVVGPKASYMRIGAAGRAWHMIGDYTMAEHCYILSMIFSPQNTGTRHLRELAQVNIDNADAEAATKYLRMLSLTPAHARWAQKRLQQLDRPPMADTSQQDTLRSANDMVRSLRHAVKTRPSNAMAYDYLMNYHLVTGNVQGLKDDYDSTRANHPWYQQALLIALTQAGTNAGHMLAYGISPAILADYGRYAEQYVAANGDLAAMEQQFGDTYWYQYHLLNRPK